MSETLTGPVVLPASGTDPRRIVILVHGYGSNGDDLIGLVPHLRADLPDALFIAPNAFMPCPRSPGGYQWWGLDTFTLEEGLAGARRAASILDAFIDGQLARYGLAEDRLALVGFSQGTVLSLHVGTRRERPVAGILGYSGMLSDAEGMAAELRSKPPVLLVHGDADPVIPVAAFRQAKTVLGGLGFDLATHVSPGLGHSIDEEGLALGREFLRRVLS